jgi:hypothetical protein
MKIVRPLSISVLAALAISAGVASAQPPQAAFVSFDDFVSSVESADASSYLGRFPPSWPAACGWRR